MTTYTDKQQKYWEKWPAKRVNKWQYIFKHGVLYYSLPVIILTFLTEKRTYTGQWELREVLIKIAVWFVAGLCWGYFMYRSQEKGYRQFINNQQAEPESL